MNKDFGRGVSEGYNQAFCDALKRILDLVDVVCIDCRKRMQIEVSPAGGSFVFICDQCRKETEICFKGVRKDLDE